MVLKHLAAGAIFLLAAPSTSVLAQDSGQNTSSIPYPPLVSDVQTTANPNRQAFAQAGIRPGTASGASGFPARPNGVRSTNAGLWAATATVGVAAVVAAGVAALLSAGSSGDSGSSSVTTTTSTE